MEESRTIRAHMLQRKQRIEAMITKRRNNLQYLKKFHEGGHYWMNIVLMTKLDLEQYALNYVPTQRVLGFFYLGLSLSKLYDNTICNYMGNNHNKVESVVKFIKGLTQLIEEFEFYFSSTAMQSVKYVLARNSSCMYPNILSSISNTGNSNYEKDNENDIQNSSNSISSTTPTTNTNSLTDPDYALKPNVYKYQSDVVYEHLLTPHMPYGDNLCYLETFTLLLDIVLRVYESFNEPACFK